MRTTADRLRHTVLFELVALSLCVPLASLILGKSLMTVGSLSLVLSISAMSLNYLYNLFFDRMLVRLGISVKVRSVRLRILHAALFETSLLIVTIPLIAWWLHISLWTAFLTDIGFALFFLVYAFVYNWIYDILFPVRMNKEFL